MKHDIKMKGICCFVSINIIQVDMGSEIKKNFVFSIGYQILVMIIPFVITPYISRVLTPEQIGEYNHANSLAYYFFLFSMLGVNSYGTREIAKVKDNREKIRNTFWQIYYIQFFLAILFIGLYTATLYVLELDKYLYWIQILYLCSVFFDINWLLLGLEKFKSFTIRTAMVKIVSIILIFLLVKSPEDMPIYGLIMTSSVTISLIFIWPIVRKIGFEAPNVCIIWKHLLPNMRLMVPYLTGSVFLYLDNFMIGFVGNIKEVAYYTYSNSLPNMLLSITTGIISVMMSRMSYIISNSKEKSNELFLRTINYTMILDLALTVGAIGVAEGFITIYLGMDYIEALPMFYIMLLTIPLNGFYSFIRSAYMIPNKMDNKVTCVSVIGCISKLVLNFMLIPIMGVLGVCVSSLISYILMIVIQYHYTKNTIHYFIILKNTSYGLLAGLIMFIYLKIIASFHLKLYLELLLQVAGGALVYMICVLLILYVKKDALVLALVNKTYATKTNNKSQK